MAGATFNLPIIFYPTEENPAPGKVIVGTGTEKYDIELTGFGREAVLIVSKPQLNFSDCIVGNAYEDTLTLKNVGEVNYPIALTTEEKFADIYFNPQSHTIPPFSEITIAIGFKPTHDVDFTCSMMIVSPYVKHFVPIKFHAGTVVLELAKTRVEFGTFEKSSRPVQTFTIKNVGTVKTVYSVKSLNKPSILQLQNSKVLPKDNNIVILHKIMGFVGMAFTETTS